MDGTVINLTTKNRRVRSRNRSNDNTMNGAVELTQNSILRMSDEKTMQLIELYEKEECLWNTRQEDYKNREKRAQAAEKIAQSLNVPHFEARHVIIKFKNLRNSYCQELKKIKHSMNSGLGPEEVYRPKVFWFPKMHSFLRPHLQSTMGSCVPLSMLTSEHEIKTEPAEIEEECWVQLTNPEDVLVPETSIVPSEPSYSEDEDVSTRDCRRSIISESRGRKRSRISRESVKRQKIDDENSIGKNLKDISAQLHLLTNREEDYYDNFGKYIASLLRSLPKQKAYHLQPKIISLITNEGFPYETGRVSQSDEGDRN